MTIAEVTEKKILWISFIAGAILALSEIIMAIYSHSHSVLMDAAYDTTDLVIGGFTLFLTPLFYKPISEKRPFGYFQIESIFVIIKGFMILSVTLGLVVTSIDSALSGGNIINPGQISGFQLVVGILSMFLLVLMSYMNKSIISPTVKVETYSWKIGVGYSFGMAMVFFIATFFDGTPLEMLTPYVDQIIAVFVALCMLPDTIKMVWTALKDVFLFAPDEKTLEVIKEVCGEILNRYNFKAVFYDVTRTGRRMWLSIYFETDDTKVLISTIQSATRVINSALADKFENCECELIINTIVEEENQIA